jgi:hypothetical protein
MSSSVRFCIEVSNFWSTSIVHYEQLAYVADKIKAINSVLADCVVC